MAESNARLILDYVKVMMWPLIFLGIFLTSRQELLDIVSNREVDAFGLRIGERVTEVQANASTELEEITRMIQELRDDDVAEPAVAEQIAARVDSLSRNLERDITQISEAAAPRRLLTPASASSAERRGVLAANSEARGFNALLRMDLDGAVDAFSEAEEAWPEYHNVAEIHRLLVTIREEAGAASNETGTEQLWKELYTTLLTSYSWGMSADIRQRMRDASQ
jgi:hypothetical protein